MRWLTAICVIAKTAGIAMPAARVARPTADQALQALEWRLLKRVRECVRDYGMIGPGETVAVPAGARAAALICARDGRVDCLARQLSILEQCTSTRSSRARPAPLADGCAASLPFDLVEEDTYSIVVEDGADSLLRPVFSASPRHPVHAHAADRRATVALGHHRDDALQTLLLNMVHQGTMNVVSATSQVAAST